jgi:heat shock protein HtpX
MWEQIRYNQTRSAILVVGMGAVWLLLGYFLGLYFFDSGIGGLIFALIFWVIICLFGYFQGDDLLLGLSEAEKIGRSVHPRLYNIVEEMKIASGLNKMPDIYIIDDPALNAFATGQDPKKASVIVTSGLLQKFNRDELQGVIGHEIAHIKNRDVQLMAMCAVLLGTIVLIVRYAFRNLGWAGMTRTMTKTRMLPVSGPGCIAQLIIVIVLMALAPIAAQLIYLTISRRREYLADASSALYTRYPEGLASALEKIAASTEQLRAADEVTAPMYIVNPFRQRGMAASDLTSTHPPISERIRILRSMASASFADYALAYRQVRDTSKVLIPAAAVATTGVIPMRAARPEDLDYIHRTRQTTNVLWNLNKYKIINCLCGTRLRLPPGFKLPEVKCPHCGRTNPV